jgi:hypothetical protein
LDKIDPVKGSPELGTTMEHTQIATTQRDSFMRAVEKEMAKFERQETDFRKKDREERAAELRAHADDYKFTH